jgi:hypothetical protein
MRPNFFHIRVVEHHAADAVARAENAPRTESSGLGCRHRLHLQLAAEEHVGALVDDDKRRALLLLVIDPTTGLAGTGRHPPVYRADIVAGQIVAHFLERQAPAAHARREPARELLLAIGLFGTKLRSRAAPSSATSASVET